MSIEVANAGNRQVHTDSKTFSSLIFTENTANCCEQFCRKAHTSRAHGREETGRELTGSEDGRKSR